MKKIAGKIALVLFGCFLALIFAEVLARLLGHEIALKARFYYKDDPQIGYDINENFPSQIDDSYTAYLSGTRLTYWSNNIGCFDDNYNNEKDFALLVGDSQTWGVAPFESKWGTLMQEYTGTRVLKCGVEGYGTEQELLKAKSIVGKVKTNPKLLVVGYYLGNDMLDDWVQGMVIRHGYQLCKRFLVDEKTGGLQTYSDQEIETQYSNFQEYCRPNTPKYPLIARVNCLFRQNFVIYPYITNVLQGVLGIAYKGLATNQAPIIGVYMEDRSTSTYPWVSQMYENNFNNVAAFKKLADSYGAKLLFVVLPTKQMTYPSLQDEFRKQTSSTLDFDQPRRVLTAFLDKEKIDYIDLFPSFSEYVKTAPSSGVGEKNSPYWPVDDHFSILGNELAGLLVSQHIVENNLLAVPPSENDLLLDKIRAALQKMYQIE